MKTLNIILAAGLVSAASLSAEEGKFELTTKIIVLPMKDFPAQFKLDKLITDDEMQLFIRKISEIDNVKLISTPSVAVKLNKVEQMEMVSEKTVTRVGTANDEKSGYTITYRLESIDEVFTLDGIFNHSEINDSEKPSIVAIDTDEIIFKRACELNKTTLVSNGDTHLFMTLRPWKKEPAAK